MSQQPLENLFTLIRESSDRVSWSRGVEYARSGAVARISESDDEVSLQITVAERLVGVKVTLWIEDEDWKCDANCENDPCQHVAGAVIALRRGLATAGASEQDTASVAAARHVAYDLSVTDDAIHLARSIVDGDKQVPLRESLARHKKRAGRKVAVTEGDLRVELALGQRLGGGRMPVPVALKVLEALQDAPHVSFDGQPVSVGATKPQRVARLSDKAGNLWLQIVAADYQGQRLHPNLLLDGECLHGLVDWHITQRWRPLIEGQTINAGDVASLLNDLLPQLRNILPVEITTQRLPETSSIEPHLVVDEHRRGNDLEVRVHIGYGSPETARVVGSRLHMLNAAARIPLRDFDAEKKLRQQAVRNLGIAVDRAETLPTAAAIDLASKVSRSSKMRFANNDGRMFRRLADLEATLIDDVNAPVRFVNSSGEEAPTSALVAAWHAGESLVSVGDQGFAPLPKDWLDRFGSQLAMLLSAKDASKPVKKLLSARLIAELDGPEAPELEHLRAFIDGAPIANQTGLPQDLRAELRPYQRDGVTWLNQLRALQLGAVLADDMGLGKTLQTLCAIDCPCLVVAPRSVIHNWQREIARFRPSLSVNVYHGARRALIDADVTITTYGLLRRDQDRLSDKAWNTIVLDEAQQIKNPTSQVAQAAYALNATWRIALTGTPIENSLIDLWSLMHFTNKGLLGGLSQFESDVVAPAQSGNQASIQLLRKNTQPLICRRLKRDVAQDLPPRTEMVLHCELSAQEREAYQALEQTTRESLVKQLEDKSVSVLSALEALLRLRQAACHLSLVPGHNIERSSKVELLIETLQTVIASGHKALVFSQWVTLLDHIAQRFDQISISHLRIDGSTRDRQSVVDQFQSGDAASVLLMSLKAGGVGLNLTAADHVFIVDPWWNPATEDQAADRAHRIGQDKPVNVFRLVAEQTVEERILALQQQKRQLADAALSGGSAGARITRDDILALLAP